MNMKRGITQLWFMAIFIAIVGFNGVTFAGEVIVDNVDMDAVSAGVWQPSSGASPYGAGSEYSNEAAATYTYTASVTPGDQEIFLWWTYFNNRCTSVDVEVQNDTTPFVPDTTVNHKISGGQWNSIGIYDIASGTANVVVNSPGGGCTTSADAVKFVDCTDPDLEVTDVTYTPAKPQVGLPATVAVTVKNNGCAEAVDFNIKWWHNGTGVSPDMNEAVASLAGGASITMEMEVTFPAVDCYESVARAKIGAQTDSNPGNNELAEMLCLGQCPPIHVSGIIDNEDAGASSTGTWSASSGQDPWATGSEYSNQAGAAYEFCASDVTGEKVVSIWYTDWNNRCSYVHVELYNNGTMLDTHIVDQSSGGGAWTVLDQHTFSGEAMVKVLSSGGCTTSADAVIFTDGDPPPVTYPNPVPNTGATVSYGDKDDGQLQRGTISPSPRFTKNGNTKTVTDNRTGLIWTKDADLNGGKLDWDGALSFCNLLSDDTPGLNDGSVAGDWALPNRAELLSLIDIGEIYPALPSNYGSYFNNVQSSWYWSATTDALFTTFAWGVYFDDGNVDNSGVKSVSRYVWCVRGGQTHDGY